MRKFITLIFILFTAFNLNAQDIKSLSLEELQQQKQEAIKSENFALAQKINDEIASRKSLKDLKNEIQLAMDKAIKEQDFIKADALKNKLKKIEEIEIIDIQIKEALKVEDFKLAQQLKTKKEGLKQQLNLGEEKAQIPKPSNNISENDNDKNLEPTETEIITDSTRVNFNSTYINTLSMSSGVYSGGYVAQGSISKIDGVIFEVRLTALFANSLSSFGNYLGIGYQLEYPQFRAYGVINGGLNNVSLDLGYGVERTYVWGAGLHFGSQIFFTKESKFGIMAEVRITSGVEFSIGLARKRFFNTTSKD